jgi:hypothetical protein
MCFVGTAVRRLLVQDTACNVKVWRSSAEVHNTTARLHGYVQGGARLIDHTRLPAEGATLLVRLLRGSPSDGLSGTSDSRVRIRIVEPEPHVVASVRLNLLRLPRVALEGHDGSTGHDKGEGNVTRNRQCLVVHFTTTLDALPPDVRITPVDPVLPVRNPTCVCEVERGLQGHTVRLNRDGVWSHMLQTK